MKKLSEKLWPELPYEKFASTGHLLHMGMQMLGKLKLLTSFEPQWNNVALWITARGLTTGPISYQTKTFAIYVDLIDHKIICMENSGLIQEFKLASMSVAQFMESLFSALKKIGIDVTINLKPQEIPDPIPFDRDTALQIYNADLANSWWRILVSSQKVMQRYHGRFTGKTQPIGFMWGTFDLRDARYNGIAVEPTGINAGYIRRNAMNEALIECGWWSGNPAYPRAAYYSFTFPQPEKIEQVKIKPAAARWDATMGLFILDYDDLLQSKNPEDDLLAFFESSYGAGATLAGWDAKLLGSGKPV